MNALRIGLIVVAFVGSSVRDRRSPPTQAGGAWPTYRHPALGFSFRHPPDLGVLPLDPTSFHIEGLVAAVDLVTRGDARVVLRFMVSEPIGNPLAVNYDRDYLRRVCSTYTEMAIGQLVAVNCVTCGSAACSWQTHILGRRQFRIMSFLDDEEAKAGPSNGTFPILTIIQSLKSH
jgi:hypothetical protein